MNEKNKVWNKSAIKKGGYLSKGSPFKKQIYMRWNIQQKNKFVQKAISVYYIKKKTILALIVKGEELQRLIC